MSAEMHEFPGKQNQNQRILACVSCQRRKIKCDKKVPCGQCDKARTQCVPGNLVPRQRRRRFPERELLERLRQYEDLLHQNEIPFEPLHDKPSHGHRNVKQEVHEEAHPPKSIWKAMNFQRPEQNNIDDNDNDDDDEEDNSDAQNGHYRDGVREDAIRDALEQLYESKDHLLFGLRKTNIDLSSLHPGQAQVFRLWQIFLDNVNPLLKVVHVPTFQPRLIDAASNVQGLDPALEALMFSIYSSALMTISADECALMFDSTIDDLLTTYQFGCEQALLNSGFLRTSDINCLTALFLYLVSARPTTDPRSLCSMLAVATRIALRMGLHEESSYSKCTVLEAEMRRRLWWALTLFDSRVCEQSQLKATTLSPEWDCHIPLNVNDFDIQPEMSRPPLSSAAPTDAIFAVVRSELGDFTRNSSFHLDFTTPALKALARKQLQPDDANISACEQGLDDKYFKTFNMENPLHYMTVWMARGYLAKAKLLQLYSQNLTPGQNIDLERRNDMLEQAFKMLDSDRKLFESPLTRRFHWFIHFHFPFIAYVHIVRDLRMRPPSEDTERSWRVLNDNYNVRFSDAGLDDNPLSRVLFTTILKTWELCCSAAQRHGQLLVPNSMIENIQSRLKIPRATDLPRGLASTPDHSSVACNSIPDQPGLISLSCLAPAQDLQSEAFTQQPHAVDQMAQQLDWDMFDWGTSGW